MEAEAQQIKTTLKALRLFDANNKCMSVNECADFLGVHRNTVTSRIEEGKIKATYICGRWSIPKLQFLEEIVK